MQAQNLGWPAGDRGNGIDVQRRRVARQDGLGFEQAVQLTKDFLFELKVFVNRFDHQVHIADRRVIIRPCHPGDPRIGLTLVDTALAHAMGIGLGHGDQGLLEHLRIVVDPLHRYASVGQAHHDAPAHGACSDHRGTLNIERCLVHVGSLVGDPKTAFTLVSRRIFLKFIRVMKGIQRMDAAHRCA
ncbi:hypothetical protein D3C76_1173060 [compost metagenome]